MKKITLFILFIICYLSIAAQEKYDNIWLVDYNGIGKPVILNFEHSPPDTVRIPLQAETVIGVSNACISDKNGKLMYYSSGCAISGRNFKILPNGGINLGVIHNNYCFSDHVNPYPSTNNIVFVPKPKDTSRYYLFHTARTDTSIPFVASPFKYFLYTEINANKAIYGSIVKKDVLLATEILSDIGPTACKHSNGKDWWVVVPTLNTHSYLRALLTDKGVYYVGKQDITKNFGYSKNDWAGQAVFSPDGTKYVRSDPFNGTYIFDFDRCTGLMSKPIFIDTISRSGSGVAISPNSRYLYIASSEVLHQYDLQADNVLQSKIKIAESDGFIAQSGYPISFYKSLLAPDNKIYIGTRSFADWLSVIHNPDEKGLDCNFKQHDLKLPKNCNMGLPNFPHYRMKAQEGVNCPPIVATKEVEKQSYIEIAPNPTNGNLTITSNELFNSTWTLYDNLGHQVFSQLIDNESITINLPSYLPKGIYFWRVTDSVKMLQQGKLVILE
jgi:hypothetical protein